MINDPMHHTPSHRLYSITLLIVAIVITSLSLCSCGTTQIVDLYSRSDHTPGGQATLIVSSMDFKLEAIDGVDDHSMDNARPFTDYKFLITPGHHVITFSDNIPGVNNNRPFNHDYIFIPGASYETGQAHAIISGVKGVIIFFGDTKSLFLPEY